MTQCKGRRLTSIALISWLCLASGPHALADTFFIKIWSYLTTETLRYHGGITDGETVFVPLARGQLLALKLTTGERLWRTQIDGEWVTGIQISERALYAAATSTTSPNDSTSSSLLAFDKQTGEKLWQKRFNNRITSLTYVVPTEASHGPRLYVGTTAGAAMAVEPETQEILWQFQSQGAVRGRAREYGDAVYIGSDDGSLYALSVRTGVPQWQFRTRGVVRARVEISATRIFLGSFDGSVYCLNRMTGNRQWEVETGAAIESQPVLFNDMLLTGSYDNFVYALNADSGALRWKTQLSGRIIADPLVLGSAVLISVLRAPKVVALHLKTGKEMSALDLGEEFDVVAPPMISGDMLTLTTNQGIFVARAVSADTTASHRLLRSWLMQ